MKKDKRQKSQDKSDGILTIRRMAERNSREAGKHEEGEKGRLCDGAMKHVNHPPVGREAVPRRGRARCKKEKGERRKAKVLGHEKEN
jgi:hypothetical protein